MQFDKGIWHAAWDVYRANLKTVAVAVALAVALDLFSEYMGRAGGSRMFIDVMIWSMMAISAHGSVLLNRANLGLAGIMTGRTFMAFVWRSLVLLLLVTVPSLVAMYFFLEAANFLPGLLKTLLVAGLAALIIFALLGTWLPAVIANGDRRIGTAIDRAERTFFYSAPRLLLGPGILQAAGIVGFALLGIGGILTGEVFGVAGFSPADLISLPVIYTLRAFTVTILAVILSRAYLIAEQTTAATTEQMPETGINRE